MYSTSLVLVLLSCSLLVVSVPTSLPPPPSADGQSSLSSEQNPLSGIASAAVQSSLSSEQNPLSGNSSALTDLAAAHKQNSTANATTAPVTEATILSTIENSTANNQTTVKNSKQKKSRNKTTALPKSKPPVKLTTTEKATPVKKQLHRRQEPVLAANSTTIADGGTGSKLAELRDEDEYGTGFIEPGQALSRLSSGVSLRSLDAPDSYSSYEESKC